MSTVRFCDVTELFDNFFFVFVYSYTTAKGHQMLTELDYCLPQRHQTMLLHTMSVIPLIDIVATDP